MHGGFAAHHSKPWSNEKPAALLKIDFPAFNLVTKRLTLTKRIRWQHLQAKGPGCAGERFLLPAEILEPRAQLWGKAWDGSTEWVRKKNRTPQPRHPRGWNLHFCSHRENPDVSLCTEILPSVHISPEGHEQASYFAHYQGFKDCMFSAHLSFPVLFVFHLFGQSRHWMNIKDFHYLFICWFALFWGLAQHPMDVKPMNNTAFYHELKCCTLCLRTPSLLH